MSNVKVNVRINANKYYVCDCHCFSVNGILHICDYFFKFRIQVCDYRLRVQISTFNQIFILQVFTLKL